MDALVAFVKAVTFVFYLLITTSSSTISNRDHRFLIENCKWGTINSVSSYGSPVNLKSPSMIYQDVVSNLMCRTRFYVNDATKNIKIKVLKFSLNGPNYCKPDSEKLIIQISGYKNITWCGTMYAEEMNLPAGAVDILYNSGASGEGTGFEIEFSAALPSSCYDKTYLNVNTQAKLLYSPNYPALYGSSLSCYVFLHTTAGQYIHIQSQLIDIEASSSCMYDALIINDVKYCGKNPVDVIINSTSVTIEFVSDVSVSSSGFILKYVTMPVETVNCASSSNQLKITTDETAVVLKNQIYPIMRPSNESTWCEITLDSGSDNRSLQLIFPTDPLTLRAYKLFLDGDQNGSGTLNITDISGPRRYNTKVSNTQNFLRSSGQQIIFSALLIGGSFTIRVQAVDRESLPGVVPAEYSLVWVNSNMTRLPTLASMTTRPVIVETEITEVGVFYSDQENPNLDSNRYPVGNYAAVFNGEDTSFFELTRGCSANTSLAKSIYSILSQSITVLIKRNASSDGFWMYFGLTYGNNRPLPVEISSVNTYVSSNHMNIKNLHCTWSLSQHLLSDMRMYSRIIRFSAENNFNPMTYTVLAVTQDESTLLKYNQNTQKDVWMYSDTPVNVTLSIFDADVDSRKTYFRFHYEIMNNSNLIQQPFCQPQQLEANETVQFASTPNYPDFYKYGQCQWTIEKSLQSDSEDHIMIEFDNLPIFLCSSEQRFQILTSDYYGNFVLKYDKCGINSFKESFAEQRVKIQFTSSSKYLLPGFHFSFYTAVLCTDINLVATKSPQYLTSPHYPNNYPDSTDCQWYITTSSDLNVVVVELVDFSLEDEYQFLYDYVAFYDGPTSSYRRIKQLCGQGFNGQMSNEKLNSTSSTMTIVFHSDKHINGKGFQLKYYSKENPKKNSDCNCGNEGVIIGVVTAAVLLIIIFVGSVICAWRRRKLRQRNNTSSRASGSNSGFVGSSNRYNNAGFIMSPTTINQRLAPPSYEGVMNSHHASAPPPYTISDVGYNLPAYAQRYGNYQDPVYNVQDLPPPYSSDMPGGTSQQGQYLEANSLGSSHDVGSAVQDPATLAVGTGVSVQSNLSNIDETAGNYRTDENVYEEIGNIAVTPNNPMQILHSPLYSLAQHPNQSGNNRQLETPPVYDGAGFLHNEIGQYKNYMDIPQEIKDDSLGSL